ncbi:MAG: succinate dehydrogenase, cytochrome b556 subunit, partial [Pseudomonadota bacterium]
EERMASTLKPRPTSPHLFIYSPQLTSMLSILHRGTGVFLAFGTVMLVAWLLALASGPEAYNDFGMVLSHPIVLLLMLGWGFSIFYHLCNGIRHLFWDVGMGYDLKQVYRSGMIVLLSASVMFLITLYFAATKLGLMS